MQASKAIAAAGIIGLAGLMSATHARGADAAAQPQGAALFQQYGCTNCHGAQGIHPTSRYAPVLRGKPADYLVDRATAIFQGERRPDMTGLMHEQFCIGAAKEEGCYPAPGESEIELMAHWLAGDSELPAKKQTPQALYVTSTQAYDRLKRLGDQAALIDVRTRAEVAVLGQPTIAAANIPYMTVGDFSAWDANKQTFKLVPNSEFVLRVNDLVDRLGLTKESPLFLIRRSGSRSARAARLLNAVGCSNVYTVTDGFEGDKAKLGPREGWRVVNGWKNNGLPWSYRLDKSAMCRTSRGSIRA